MDSIKIDGFPVNNLNQNRHVGQKYSATDKTFSDFLNNSINQVNSIQQDANAATQQLANGNDADLHNTMIKVQKAEVSFELLLQIQNKLLTAYDELKRMQI